LPEDESPYDFSVSLFPSAGTVGTVVTITATDCAGGEEVEFADRQVVDAGASTPGKSVPFQSSGQTLTAKYTIAPDDSLGGAVVTVICGNGEGLLRWRSPRHRFLESQPNQDHTASETLLPMGVARDDLGLGNARVMAGFVTVNQLVGPPDGTAVLARDEDRRRILNAQAERRGPKSANREHASFNKKDEKPDHKLPG
jgi:hypothetical protein